MSKAESLRKIAHSATDAYVIGALVESVRHFTWRLADKPAQHLELHPCARNASEILLAQHVARHSLIDDNPCSG